MWIRILLGTLRRHPRRVAITALAVAVGAALATALLAISLDITTKMARELRNYGANILVTSRDAGLQVEIGGMTINPPAAQGAIDDNKLTKLKTIFWRHNIVGFAPFLSTVIEIADKRAVLTGTWFDKPLTITRPRTVTTGSAGKKMVKAAGSNEFRTGVRTISPWWQVEGGWVQDDDPNAAIVGTRLADQLALRVDQTFTVRHEDREQTLRVAGLVSTGGDEEEQIFVSLPVVQGLLGLHKGADKVLVSALVEPQENLREDLRGLDPKEMTPEQYETWYCSPIMGAVVKQIEEALPGTKARPIRRIAEAEGAFLNKVGLLMTLLTLTALVAAGLAVMTAMTATVQERRAEIGLMKAVGADDAQVALIFLSQAGLIGIAGGLLGYVAGLGLAIFVGQQVFDATIALPPLVLPVVLVLALGVALTGSALPVRRAMHFNPASLMGVAK